jgi:hypothetical protein
MYAGEGVEYVVKMLTLGFNPFINHLLLLGIPDDCV